MGSLSRASRQSLAMGPVSTQVRSTEVGSSGADQSMLTETSYGGTRKKKKSQKSRKNHKAAIEGPGREQESARALLQLKQKVPLKDKFIPAREDEIPKPTMFSAVNVNGKYNIETHGIDEANQVTDKCGKRKRQRLEFRTEQGRDDVSSKRARLNKSINKFKSQTALLPSLITSDLTIEETNVNLLPGDEQEVRSSGTSSTTQIMPKPKPITQEPIGEADKERPDPPIQPLVRPPSLAFGTPQRQNHLKERCNQSDRGAVLRDGAAQKQPNHPDLFLPIDPALTNDPPLCVSTPLEKPAVRPRQEKSNQHHLINAPAEATGDIDSHVDITNVRTNQPKGMGGNQKYRVPPETENLPRYLPPESDSFDEWSLNSEDSDDSTSEAKGGKTTPPPLAKRSRPLGNKTQQGGKKPKDYNPPLDQIAIRGGVWTQAEISRLDAFRDKYCTENGLSTFKFNAMVQSSIRYDKDVTELFKEAHLAFPYRTRMSVTRFCRRRYHNFPARGTWTESEDESLKQAVIVKGRSWKAVGEMINRFPEDCRDRYRNYHINAENRNRESWTDAEILNLCRAVHDCMLKMKELKEQARSEKFVGREVPESESESDHEVRDSRLINWQIVSDAMGPGGGRSRLQCSLKWAQLRMTDRANFMKRVNGALRGSSLTDNDKTKKPKTGNWRVARAVRELGNLKPGDRYDFLQAFATCKAREEGNIAWRSLGDQAFRSRWTTVERKAALQIFKSEIPDGNKMDYRDLANRLLTRLMADSGHRLGERCEKEQNPDANAEVHSAKEMRRNGLLKKSRREGIPKNIRREGLPKGVEDEKIKRDKLVISIDVQEEGNDVQEPIEHGEILLGQSTINTAAQVEMPSKDMSDEASNGKTQECHESLHLSEAATDDGSRKQSDEDLDFDTDDDSLFESGNESPERKVAAAHEGAREASSGGAIYATPDVSGKAAADAALGDSSAEDASDRVTHLPQIKALLKVDEASANDRFHDNVFDKDMITATSPRSEVPDSPLRNSTVGTDDETQLYGGSDDDVMTDSDVDSLFGRPFTR